MAKEIADLEDKYDLGQQQDENEEIERKREHINNMTGRERNARIA